MGQGTDRFGGGGNRRYRTGYLLVNVPGNGWQFFPFQVSRIRTPIPYLLAKL